MIMPPLLSITLFALFVTALRETDMTMPLPLLLVTLFALLVTAIYAGISVGMRFNAGKVQEFHHAANAHTILFYLAVVLLVLHVVLTVSYYLLWPDFRSLFWISLGGVLAWFLCATTAHRQIPKMPDWVKRAMDED